MKVKWFKTSEKGLRYRKHPKRKHGIDFDRFYQFRHTTTKDGEKIRIEESLGWLSEGWTEDKCKLEILKIKQAKKTGEGPSSLSEKRKKAEAKRQKEIEAQKAAEAAAAAETLANKPFSDHWNDYFKADSSKKPATWLTEEGLYKKWIKPVIGKKPLGEITDLNIEAIKRKMKKPEKAEKPGEPEKPGKSDRTVEYALQVIRQVYRFAIKNKSYSGEIPAIRKRKTGGLLPEYDNRKRRYLTRTEADALLTEIKKHSKDVHDMTLLSLNAALRAGEIFSLTWGCVDIERGRLTLLDTKSKNETRTAFLNDTAKAMFQNRTRGKNNELVFPNTRGGKIVQISDTFNNAVAKLGLNDDVTDRRFKVTFHTCRHTAASWMVENKTPLYFVKEILGHKNITTTERYSHNIESNLEAAIKALDTTTAPAEETGAEVIELSGSK